MSSGSGGEESDTPDQEKSVIKDLPGLAAFATMGTSLAGCLALGVVLGLYVDHLWHFAPGGLIIGIVLGTVAAVLSVRKLVRRYL